MKRKPYTFPEELLRQIVPLLEAEDERGHRKALLGLLSRGPLLCSETLLEALQEPYAAGVGHYRAIRSELLAFLRTLAREKGDGRFTEEWRLKAPIRFRAAANGRDVMWSVAGDAHDLVVLQLVLLLHEVGLGQVRVCEAPDCDRLFVKTYRREFCSTRCQKRTHAAVSRADPLAPIARRLQRRRRQQLTRRAR